MIVLPDADVDRLPEYSCSVPTGTTIGKRWVCFWPVVPRGQARQRLLGQYVESDRKGWVAIHWEPLLTETEAGAIAAALFWWLP